MPPREGLPGLDSSLTFSPDPLDHLFLVIHGAGDPYVDHQPWLSSLENCLTAVEKNYALLSQNLHKSKRNASLASRPSSALFLPVEWHGAAFETWQHELRNAGPSSQLPGAAEVRAAVSEMVGDVIMMASPFWRQSIARHVAKQIESQLNAVRRNRPAFSGRISIVAHSVGGLIAVELLGRGLLKERVDAVMMVGCPMAAYAALAPEEMGTLATVRKMRKQVRFVNVFHPLDPVAYRLEPFVLKFEDEAPVKVTAQKRTFWDDASVFWDDVVYNLWSTLFPEGRGGRVGEAGVADMFGGRPKVDGESSEKEERRGLQKVKNDNREGRGELRRSCGYVFSSNEDMGGSETLLSGRIDFELQDGMAVPTLDVMAAWGGIKAHTYYWQSLDVAQMLLDIVVTSEQAFPSKPDNEGSDEKR